ncbi:MAG TPA: hypothetical protein VG992_04755 [Candidatus Saccharimonadales bacterium]|nr:hypothetical protein [Candidatus Saccharimonadales bacterium]
MSKGETVVERDLEASSSSLWGRVPKWREIRAYLSVDPTSVPRAIAELGGTVLSALAGNSRRPGDDPEPIVLANLNARTEAETDRQLRGFLEAIPGVVITPVQQCKDIDVRSHEISMTSPLGDQVLRIARAHVPSMDPKENDYRIIYSLTTSAEEPLT